MPKVTKNVEAIILWQLHEVFGFGKKRLIIDLDKINSPFRETEVEMK